MHMSPWTNFEFLQSPCCHTIGLISIPLLLDSEIKASACGFLIFSTQRRFDVVDWNGIEEL